MKIFIAGATGVLGRRLVERFSGRGHEVVGLARSDEKAELVRRLGGSPARASLFDADALARAAEGANIVVHAATSLPGGSSARWRKAWRMNDRIRREGTRALAGAAGAVGARRYIQQSVAWVVKRPAGGPFYDEDTPPNPPELLRSAVDGEEIAREAGAEHGFEVAVLRGGSFYAPDADSSRSIAELLLARRLPIIGRGEFLVAPVHADDAARAFVVAAEAERADDTWNVVDDEPVSFAGYLTRFARELGARSPRRAPVWLARLLLGRHVVESLTTSMNTSNAKIVRDLGWRPEYPTHREGLAQLAAKWRREGFIPVDAEASGPRRDARSAGADVVRSGA